MKKLSLLLVCGAVTWVGCNQENEQNKSQTSVPITEKAGAEQTSQTTNTVQGSDVNRQPVETSRKGVVVETNQTNPNRQ